MNALTTEWKMTELRSGNVDELPIINWMDEPVSRLFNQDL